MTLTRFMSYLSVAALLLTFCACSDDDDDEAVVEEPAVVIPLSTYVVGSYTSSVDMAFAYGTQAYDSKTITITANADNADAIDIAFSDDELGTLTGAVGIAVTDNNNDSYTFASYDSEGNELVECLLSMPNHSGGTSDYACLVSGTISADHAAYEIVLSMPGVMGGTTYTFTPEE